MLWGLQVVRKKKMHVSRAVTVLQKHSSFLSNSVQLDIIYCIAYKLPHLHVKQLHPVRPWIRLWHCPFTTAEITWGCLVNRKHLQKNSFFLQTNTSLVRRLPKSKVHLSSPLKQTGTQDSPRVEMPDLSSLCPVLSCLQPEENVEAANTWKHEQVSYGASQTACQAEKKPRRCRQTSGNI